jgi:hypothetical protein
VAHSSSPRCDTVEPQQIVIEVDVMPGPFVEAVAERLLRTVVEELRDVGAETTRVRLEIRGRMASW